MNSHQNKRIIRFWRVLETTLKVIVLTILVGLASCAVLFTAHIVIPETQVPGDVMSISGIGNNTLRYVLIPAAFIPILIIILYTCWRLAKKLQLLPLSLGIAIAVFLFQVAWLAALGTQNFGYADSRSLDHLARSFLTGDRSQFSGPAFDDNGNTVSYIALYPFQSGTTLWFILVYYLFGIGNQLGFQVLNAGIISIGILSLIYITHRSFHNENATRWSGILLLFSFPLLMSSAFVYGNSAGLGLSLSSFALSLAAMQAPSTHAKRKTILSLLSFFTIVLAILVKTTSILFLIPLFIVWLIHAFRRHRPLLAVPVVALFLIATQTTTVAISILEHETGEEFGKGMPQSAWIAMGLSDYDLLGVPGWWGPDVYSIYTEANGDYTTQQNLAIESIGESVTKFIQDPGYAFSFFSTKIGSEWLDPSYQSIYYSAIGDSFNDSGVLTNVLYDGFKSNTAFYLFSDALQTLVYAAAAIAIVDRIKNRRISPTTEGELLLLGTFLLGFVVYTLWEAKSIYTLPYYAILIPLSAMGCQIATTRVRLSLDRSRSRFRNKITESHPNK